jgi:hypothetical protein
MTLPRSAADVLADHVLFEIEAIDRMYLNVYQPRLQYGAGDRRVLRRAPRSPVRLLGADGTDDEEVCRRYRAFHRGPRAGPGALRLSGFCARPRYVAEVMLMALIAGVTAEPVLGQFT